MLDPSDLRRLALSRWHVPLLAFIYERGGARFVEFLTNLDLSRSALSRVLANLQETGWIMPNPGHGHPLRPEYILSKKGTIIAAWCAQLMEQRRQLGLESDNLPRWSLPLVARLDRGWTRFSALQTDLTPITPRALSLTLKRMLLIELVDRKLENGFPPHSLYGLTRRGRDLAAAIAA